MLIPLIVLSIGALFAGLGFQTAFIGTGAKEFWRGAVALGSVMEDMHHVPHWVPFIAFWMMSIGFVVSTWMYVVKPGSAQQLAARHQLAYKFLLNKWYFDELYDAIFTRPAFSIGFGFWKKGDMATIDGLGPDNIAANTIRLARRAAALQTGYIYHYAFAMLIGVVVLVTWYLLVRW